MSQQDYAGKYLYKYEGLHYSLWQWVGKLGDPLRSILLPPDAEQFADVSFYQPGMNWTKYQQQARATIIRVGQALWGDTEFEYNYAEAKALGLGLGGYWFYDDRYSPAQQAAAVKQTMAGKTLEMELFVDWENTYGGSYNTLNSVVDFMQLLDGAGLHVKAIGLYTGYYWFKDHSNAATHVTQYKYLALKPLWLAWYAAASLVQVPAPWLTWTHWQLGTPIVDWGQPKAPTRLDMNKSNHTPVEFYNTYLSGIIPPDPGANMPQIGTCISTTHELSLRNLHQVAGSVSAVKIPINTRLVVSEIWVAPETTSLNNFNDLWAFVIYGTRTGWVGLKHLGLPYGVYTPDQVVPPPPVVTLPVLPVTITLGDGVTYAKQTVTVNLQPLK